MTDSKMPERIWAGDYNDTDGGGYWWLDPSVNTGLAEYIRADLAHPAPAPDAELEAAAKGMVRIVEEIDGAMNHGTWRDENGVRLKDTPEWVALYNAITALRARTAQPVGTRVRKLEWAHSITTYLDRETGKELPSAEFWHADTTLVRGRYTIMRLVDARLKGDTESYRLNVGREDQKFPTLEAAKAAAQADYEQRIISAILPEGGA